MRITCDPAKSASNFAKHGVSLEAAAQIEWETSVSWQDQRRPYGEDRYCGLAFIGLRLYFVAYVDRVEGRRIISLRKAIFERSHVMPKLKAGVILPTQEEDAAITAAAQEDPESQPLTDAEWESVKVRLQRGRPASSHPLKQPTTIRFDADVLAGLKATGRGWQTRVNEAMRQWLKARETG